MAQCTLDPSLRNPGAAESSPHPQGSVLEEKRCVGSISHKLLQRLDEFERLIQELQADSSNNNNSSSNSSSSNGSNGLTKAADLQDRQTCSTCPVPSHRLAELQHLVTVNKNLLRSWINSPQHKECLGRQNSTVLANVKTRGAGKGDEELVSTVQHLLWDVAQYEELLHSKEELITHQTKQIYLSQETTENYRVLTEDLRKSIYELKNEIKEAQLLVCQKDELISKLNPEAAPIKMTSSAETSTQTDAVDGGAGFMSKWLLKVFVCIAATVFAALFVGATIYSGVSVHCSLASNLYAFDLAPPIAKIRPVPF